MKIKIFCFLAVAVLIMCGCTDKDGTTEKVPTLINVTLEDENSVEIAADENGWIPLKDDTRIHVQFKGDVDYIFFYLTPRGTETFSQRELVGVASAYDNDSTGEKGFGIGKTTVQYKWNVPDKSFDGVLGIELMSGTVARYEGNVADVINR